MKSKCGIARSKTTVSATVVASIVSNTQDGSKSEGGITSFRVSKRLHCTDMHVNHLLLSIK